MPNLAVPLDELEISPVVVNSALRESVHLRGIIDPPLVMLNTTTSRYRVIDGNQRIQALRELDAEIGFERRLVDVTLATPREACAALAPRDNVVRLLRYWIDGHVTHRQVADATGWADGELAQWFQVARHELFAMAEARVISLLTCRWMIDVEGNGSVRPAEISGALHTVRAWGGGVPLEPLTMRRVRSFYRRAERERGERARADQSTLPIDAPLGVAPVRPPLLVDGGIVQLVPRDDGTVRARTATSEGAVMSEPVALQGVSVWSPIIADWVRLTPVAMERSLASRTAGTPSPRPTSPPPTSPEDLMRATLAMVAPNAGAELTRAAARVLSAAHAPSPVAAPQTPRPAIIPIPSASGPWAEAVRAIERLMDELPVSPSQLCDEAMRALNAAAAMADRVAQLGVGMEGDPAMVDAPVESIPDRPRPPRVVAGVEVEDGENATRPPSESELERTREAVRRGARREQPAPPQPRAPRAPRARSPRLDEANARALAGRVATDGELIRRQLEAAAADLGVDLRTGAPPQLSPTVNAELRRIYSEVETRSGEVITRTE